VGPLLAAALTLAARSGEVGRGALLLLAYAFGIGVPFMLAALGLASFPALADRLKRMGPSIERVAGVLLIVLGLLLVTGEYAHLTSYLARFTPAVGGL
jgi:cytochrome c-type biogenesis protein